MNTFPKPLALSCLFLLLLTSGAFAQRLEGVASFYGNRFEGKLTSTGETFRQKGFTAASNDLPWGTIVEVTNKANGKKTQVRINDCGPHSKGRIIDITRAAARALGFEKQGEAQVSLRVILASNSGPTCNRGAWAKNLKAQGKAVPPPPPPWNPRETAAIETERTDNEILVPPSTPPLEGMAGYYPDRLHGRKTSTGETYNRAAFTAASKTYPYGTVLEVINVVSGASVNVKVNDCGPISEDRIIDLSYAAAARVGVLRAGVAAVRLRVIQLGTDGPTCNRLQWSREQQAGTVRPGQAAPPSPTVPGAPATYGGSVRPPVAASPVPEGLVTAYAVQVGAFSAAANANKLAQELVDKGYADVGSEAGGNLTKVYAGNFADAAAAKEMEKKLRQDGYPKATMKQVMVPAAAAPTIASRSVATPVPASPPPAAPARQFDPSDILFGVQVGAFGTKTNADKAMADLRTKGFQEVYSAKVGKMTRVFSGKFYFQHQAQALKTKLREAGYASAAVRRVQ